MTTNFISAQKLEKFATRISKLIGRRVNKIDYPGQLNISSGGLTITGTTSDLNIQITEKEKVKIQEKVCVAGICEEDQVGNIQYKVVYKCTITGLPPVIKNAWKNVEYKGQSLQQNSPYQDYIYNSINTLGTSGTVDWGEVGFKQSISIKNITPTAEGYTFPSIGNINLDIPKIDDLPSQPIGFDLNLNTPSTFVATENCTDPDDTSTTFGTVYDTPTYQQGDIGFSVFPHYESIYISNLDMGYIFPSIASSIDEVDSSLESLWKDAVCPVLNVIPGVKCPKLKLPKGGETTEEISSAIQSALNKELALIDVSMYPPLATARIWDKKVYNKKKSDLFTGDPVTCNDISDAYEEYWPTYHKQKKKHNKSYNDTFNSLINDCEQNYENGSLTSSGYSNCVEQVSWAYEAITGDPAPTVPSASDLA